MDREITVLQTVPYHTEDYFNKLPMIKFYSSDKHDENAVLEALLKAKEMGAEAVCTRDIDLLEMRKWNERLAEKAGLIPCFPLWEADRLSCINEIIDKGYVCMFTLLNRRILSEEPCSITRPFSTTDITILLIPK